MNGFERRREQNKERIRRAALELFKVSGFKKVSINNIAEKAAVSPVTIYNNFGSKEDLVRDVIKRLMLSTKEKYRAIIEGEKPFLEKLELIIFDKTDLSRRYNGELIQEVASNDPKIQQLLESMYQQEVSQRLVNFFEEGKRLGYVNPKLSQEGILLYSDIFRKGFFAHTDLFVVPEHNVKLLRELFSLYLYGLMGKRGGSSDAK